MTSNQDILIFLKADQEAKAKEKEEDMETRARERKEDREHILAMIKTGVEREVRAAIEPVEQRLELQENLNKELFKKLNSLALEVDLLKRVNAQQQDFPALPEPQQQQQGQGHGEQGHWGQWHGEQGHGGQGHGVQEQISDEKRDLCSAARKVVGFTPIVPRMLEIQLQSYGAKDMEEAMLMEVKSYLKCEMKMLPSVIEKLNFVRIFPPAREDWNVLYVEFGSDQEVDTVFKHTRNMVQKDHRVTRWTPKQMFDRFRAIQSLAYTIRQEEGLKTRVKIGQTDFLLSTRSLNSSIWRPRTLPSHLPEIDLDQIRTTLSTDTHPPGRPSLSRTGPLSVSSDLKAATSESIST